MREITFKEIEDLWSQNIYPVMMYIHSPFCKTNCTYCVYKGTTNLDGFEEYYQNYLPSQIDKYQNIISNQNIKYIYFGGGTPSINGELNHLIPILEKIRDLKVDEKTIELHTGWLITEEQLDFLKKYGFNTIVLCIQSFQNTVLDKVNRYHEYDNDIDHLIEYSHKIGLRVAVDLMAFPDLGLQFLVDDLNYLNTFKNLPDELSIGLDYHQKNNFARKRLLNLIEENSFLTEKMIPECGFINENIIFSCKSIRYFSKEGYDLKNQNKFFSFMSFLEEGNSNAGNRKGSGPIGSAVLGIGSYKNLNKWTYSNCGKYSYFEECNNLKEDSKYFLTKELSYYDKIRNLLDWMESVNGPEAPFGLTITCKNLYMSNVAKNQGETLIDFNISNSSPYNDFIDNLNKNKSQTTLEKILLKK